MGITASKQTILPLEPTVAPDPMGLDEAIRQNDTARVAMLLHAGTPTDIHVCRHISGPLQLKLGTDSNMPPYPSRSPLALAVWCGCKLAIIQSLVQAGANPNETQCAGQSVFHHAVTLGRIDLVTYFLLHGVSNHILNRHYLDESPLQTAIQRWKNPPKLFSKPHFRKLYGYHHAGPRPLDYLKIIKRLVAQQANTDITPEEKKILNQLSRKKDNKGQRRIRAQLIKIGLLTRSQKKHLKNNKKQIQPEPLQLN